MRMSRDGSPSKTQSKSKIKGASFPLRPYISHWADAVAAALVEYIQRRKQLRILRAFGTVDFDPTYDYKAERRRGRRCWQSA